MGNVLTTGYYEDRIDLESAVGPGPSGAMLVSAGRKDAFVTKRMPSGELIWARSFGGEGSESGTSIAVDEAGNVYCVGEFTGVSDFDPGAGVYSLSSAGFSDVFVCKLSPEGNFLWARSFGGTETESNRDVAVDADGNVYCVGTFTGDADFDPGDGTFSMVSAGNRDGYLLSLDSAGSFRWARSVSGTFEDSCAGVAIDDEGFVYGTGSFWNGALIGGVEYARVHASNDWDAFVYKFDQHGDLQWVKVLSGEESTVSGGGIAISQQGAVVYTGSFRGNPDFDPGAGEYFLSPPASSMSTAYIASLSLEGVFQWAVAVEDIERSRGVDVAVDVHGDVYAFGDFRNEVDLDPGDESLTRRSRGMTDTYICKLNEHGEFLWGGAFGSLAEDHATGIAVDSNKNVYCTGYFSLGLDIEPGTELFDIRAVGEQDAFLLRLEPSLLPVAMEDFGETYFDEVLTVLDDGESDSLLANDRDENTVDVLEVVGYDDTSLHGATVVVAPDGTFTYDPRGVAEFQSLPTGESIADYFHYTVSDGANMATGRVSVTVLGTAPAAIEIVPATLGPTNSDSVAFDVVFNEEVTGFDGVEDMVLHNTGTVSTGIGVSGGPTTYSVTVDGISGDGSFSLSARLDAGVTNLSGRGLVSSVVSDVVVVDNTGPVITMNEDTAEANTVDCGSEVYVEPGAMAVDALDGVVEVSATGVVDSATPGSYSITYTAEDRAGNQTVVIRNVTVLSNCMVGGEGEGEGEGEDEDDAIVAEALLRGLISADANGDGLLSLAEARAVVPALSAERFAVYDIDQDGLLSRTELATHADDRAPVGCFQDVINRSGLKWAGSDFFLLGLVMMTLAACRNTTHRS